MGYPEHMELEKKRVRWYIRELGKIESKLKEFLLVDSKDIDGLPDEITKLVRDRLTHDGKAHATIQKMIEAEKEYLNRLQL
jgi:hypothetical protein